MKNECSVVQDLLPLYAEKMTSEDTNEFIEEHLASCETCSHMLEDMQKETAAEEEVPELPLAQLSRKYKKDKTENFLLAACLVISILLSVFSFLTVPHYLSGREAISHIEAEGGTVTVEFEPAVRHFRCSEYTDVNGEAAVDIECWTTKLDELFYSGEKKYTVVPDANIWYLSSQAGDADDELLYGTASDGGRQTLRRLALNLYMMLAAAAAAVLGLVWLFVRKTKYGETVLRILLVPVCWICADLIVEGGPGSATFSIMRDFTLICLLTASLYGTLFLLHRRYLEKKAVVN